MVAGFLPVGAGPASALVTSFAPGSLIIPMDTGTNGQDAGMLRAYGLVYSLLRNNVPVHWAINPTKGVNGDDFVVATANTLQDVRTGAVLPPRSYRGGPFLIQSTDAAVARPIIQAWQAAETGPAFTAVHLVIGATSINPDIARLLVAAPRIALLKDGSEAVAFADLNAAGIPDSAGNSWSSTSPDLLTEADVAGATTTAHTDGALFAGGLPRYCQLTAMSYGPTATTPEVVQEVRSWLRSGSLTHAFLQNEATTVFENDATAGRFLTTGGIVDDGATPATSTVRVAADPLTQLDGTFQADLGAVDSIGLNGGSFQAGAQTLINDGGALIQHIVALTGRLDGSSLNGRVTWLAGHDYSTALPVSTNPQTNGVRLYLNSILDADCATTAPQPDVVVTKSAPASIDAASADNTHIPYTITLRNPGPRTAENLVVTDTLPAGTSYLVGSATPTPTSITGQVVTWNLPPLASAATTTITFKATMTGDGTYLNTASASFAHLTVRRATSNAATTVRDTANHAPALDAAKTPVLSSVAEDAGAPVGNVGTRVTALVDATPPAGGLDNVADSDPSPQLGLAVTAAQVTNGSWWYSTNDGTSWSSLGSPSATTSRLLSAAGGRLYFQPTANFTSTVVSALTFRAWDQTSGSNGGTADTTTNGGATAFSVATDTADITVSPVNDAPVLDASRTPVLSPVNGNAGPPIGNVGTRVTALVDPTTPAGGLDNVTGVDVGALLGVAVIGADATNGSWFYSIDDGASWSLLGPPSDSSARLLPAAGGRVYFQPTTGFSGPVPSAITFRAWDLTTGTSGALANVVANGGTTAFSAVTDTAAITVGPTATITSGPSGPTNDATPDFTFTTSGSPTIIQCRLDGGSFTACLNSYTSAPLASGPHTFDVRVEDASANSSTASRSFSVDTTAPVVSVPGPPTNPLVTSDPTPTFSFSITDASATTAVCSVLDSFLFTRWTGPCSAPTFTVPNASALADGSYTFTLNVTDAAGNAAPLAFRPFTVDTAAPNVIVLAPPSPTSTQSHRPTFTFSVAPGGTATSVVCRAYPLSDPPPTAVPCASPYTVPTSLPDGNYVFEVIATDGAANVGNDLFVFTVDTLAPTANINVLPPNPTNDNTPQFGFTTAGAPTTTECRIDTVAFAACVSPYVAPFNISDGTHTFDVRVTDAAGNASTASAPFVIDTNAPVVAISSAAPTLTASHHPAFAFSVTDLHPGVSDCYVLDSTATTVVTQLNCSSPFVPTVTAEGNYTVSVVATDAAGNAGSDTHDFTLDTTAPTLTITGGPSGPTSNPTPTFVFVAGGDVASIACHFDTEADVPCLGNFTPPAPLAGGVHIFHVQVSDLAGNSSAASRTFTVDLSPPETTILATDPARTNQTTRSFILTANEVATFECRLDGGAFGPCSGPSSFTTPTLGEGFHTFEARAIDGAGNVDPTPAVHTWFVDLSPAETTFTALEPSPTTDPTGDFEFVSEPGATFECSVDSAVFTACPSPFSTTTLADGPHTFAVRATDPVGNVDASPASYAWTLDTGFHECGDGLDNDLDGRTDFAGGDPGCSSALDDSELGSLVCDDGIDNDGDGRIDFRTSAGDLGCGSVTDPSERTSTYACDDGIDNDLDGKIDFRLDAAGDPGCTSPVDTDEFNSVAPPPRPACSDGLDNDHDGLIDFHKKGGDPGCSSLADNDETNVPPLPACSDGLDNDHDGRIDFHKKGGDPGCSSATDNSEN
jgi:uncharacterized repeat protein (TIGR01451 family)